MQHELAKNKTHFKNGTPLFRLFTWRFSLFSWSAIFLYMSLNSEQKELQTRIQEFLKSKKNGFFGVLGAGGTGKSYTICQTIDVENALFLGATNKVCSVLKNYLSKNGYVNFKVKTIDSFFGFKMKKDHNNVTVITHRKPNIKDIPKIIVIDEISLINDRSYDLLMEMKDKKKFILIGDDMQIPPIEATPVRNDKGFKVSKIFMSLDESFTLTVQNRQKDGTGLYNLISRFRDNMDKSFDYIKMVEKYKNGDDILYFDINDRVLKNLIFNKNIISVGFKNLTCLSFNWLIGSTKTNNKGYKVNDLNIGDVVFFDGFYKRGNDVFYTSETVSIIDIDPFNEETIKIGNEYATYNYKKILVKDEDGFDKIIYCGNGYKETLYPIKYRVDKQVNKIKNKIDLSKNVKAKWALRNEIAELNTKYSELKTGFATLKKPFAITSHKAQGSTYSDVIIPIYDFAAKHHQDSNQLLYVAMSRAKERIIFVNNKSHFRNNENRYSFTEMERNAIASYYDYKCNLCHSEFEELREIDIDHIVPLAFGGKNTIDNLQPLCKNCHQNKTKNEKHNTKHETAI